MAGDGPQTVAAAEELAGLIPADVAKTIPPVQGVQQAPYLAHAQFSPAARVMGLRDPGGGVPSVQATCRYAPAMALIHAGNLAAAADEQRQLERIATTADFAELQAWLVPAKDVLMVADK